MTKREFYLRLFNENGIALAAAIHLIERFVNNEQIQSGQDFLLQKRRELELPMDPVAVRCVFEDDYE